MPSMDSPPFQELVWRLSASKFLSAALRCKQAGWNSRGQPSKPERGQERGEARGERGEGEAGCRPASERALEGKCGMSKSEPGLRAEAQAPARAQSLLETGQRWPLHPKRAHRLLLYRRLLLLAVPFARNLVEDTCLKQAVGVGEMVVC